jgi:predicted RNA-binding protein with RPS1 domain
MFINKGTFAFWCLGVKSTAAFSGQALHTNRINFVSETQGNAIDSQKRLLHSSGCGCNGCSSTRRGITLFSNVVEGTEVPPEILAMDGVESSEEAHNIDRPARQQIKKKKPVAGKTLSEFEEGSTVTGTIKSLASYGAFVDIGATTDGLLHVSQLSTEFVSDVSDVVKEGQQVEVRIVKIDSDKGQIALSMMTAEEESEANEAAKKSRKSRGNNRQNNRRDSAALGALNAKGWDTALMVEGTVVSTTNFGAFVKVDASKLNSEIEGEFDGLVHISVLKIGRVSSVEEVVSPNDKVQVRCKSIDGNKVSLTMLSVEDEETKNSSRGGGGGGDFESQYMGDMGAKDWQESCDSIEEKQTTFSSGPLVNSPP